MLTDGLNQAPVDAENDDAPECGKEPKCPFAWSISTVYIVGVDGMHGKIHGHRSHYGRIDDHKAKGVVLAPFGWTLA